VSHLGGLPVTCIIYALTSHAISIFTDEYFAAALAQSLEVSEDNVRFEYAKWLMRYNKAADETRYPAFVKNLLTQVQNNREYGQNASLNEYGDISEGTYRT
jgi:hypothetical protein